MFAIINATINAIINSLPEEGFIFAFIFFILMKLKVVEFDKPGFRKFLAVTIPVTARVSNIKRFWIDDANIVLVAMLLFIVFMTIVTLKIERNNFLKVSFAVFLSLVALQFAELYIIVYLAKTGITDKELNNSSVMSFYVSIPERLLEYLALAYVYRKKVDDYEVDFCKTHKRIICSLLVFTFIYYCLLVELVLSAGSNSVWKSGSSIILAAAVPLLVLWISLTIMYYRDRKNIIDNDRLRMLEEAREYCILKERRVMN